MPCQAGEDFWNFLPAHSTIPLSFLRLLPLATVTSVALFSAVGSCQQANHTHLVVRACPRPRRHHLLAFRGVAVWARAR